MHAFIHDASPMRVLFGAGTLAKVGDEATVLGIERAMVLSTPRQQELREATIAFLGARCAARFAGASMHTPVTVTQEALRAAQESSVDGFVAVGGGSTTGLGKALARRTGLPLIAVATTYAGSEMTSVIGETHNGQKTTVRDPKVLPRTVIYDVALTKNLPPRTSALSGLNAMAHAVEAMYAQNRNPLTSLIAEEGCRAFMSALPKIMADPGDMSGREEALYGAWLCGICLQQTEMGLHHKLCHTLGGSFDLPHAETHSVMLPHTLAYNANHAPEAIERLTRAFGGDDPVVRIFQLLKSVGGPSSLRDLNMPEAGIARASELALAKPYPNPRPLERGAVEALLNRAWAGSTPQRC